MKKKSKAKSKAKPAKKPKRAKKRFTSPDMRKIDELNEQVRRSTNQAKTARNFQKAAKDAGIKRLYREAASYHIKAARAAQKAALKLMAKISE